jgi:YggT family protein
LPPIGKVDSATLVAVIAVAAARTATQLAFGGLGFGNPLLFVRVTALSLVDMLLRVYLFALLLYWLTSYLSRGSYAPGVRLLAQLCEPILKPVRRLIPPIGQIDFSVLWVAIVISALLILLR